MALLMMKALVTNVGLAVKSSLMHRDKNDLILGSTKIDEMFNGLFKKSFYRETGYFEKGGESDSINLCHFL